jgi:hypothetical protein
MGFIFKVKVSSDPSLCPRNNPDSFSQRNFILRNATTYTKLQQRDSQRLVLPPSSPNNNPRMTQARGEHCSPDQEVSTTVSPAQTKLRKVTLFDPRLEFPEPGHQKDGELDMSRRAEIDKTQMADTRNGRSFRRSTTKLPKLTEDLKDIGPRAMFEPVYGMEARH